MDSGAAASWLAAAAAWFTVFLAVVGGFVLQDRRVTRMEERLKHIERRLNMLGPEDADDDEEERK